MVENWKGELVVEKKLSRELRHCLDKSAKTDFSVSMENL